MITLAATGQNPCVIPVGETVRVQGPAVGTIVDTRDGSVWGEFFIPGEGFLTGTKNLAVIVNPV